MSKTKFWILSSLIILLGSAIFIKTFMNMGSLDVYQDPEKLAEIKKLKLELRDSPKDVTILTTIGDLFYGIGSYKNSEKYYKEAITWRPDDPNLYQKLANVYRYEGLFAESEKVFKEALKISPDSDFIYVDMGKLYRNWGKYDLAEESFKKALLINPKSDTAYGYGLGYLYRDMKKLDLAETSFKKAFELSPSEFNYMGLGDIYREEKKFTLAETMFKKAISLNPNSEALQGLGWLYMDEGQFAKAEVTFKTYLTHVRPKGEVYMALAVSQQEQGKLKDAESNVRKAIELNSRTPDFYNVLFTIYEREDKHFDAFLTKVRKFIFTGLT